MTGGLIALPISPVKRPRTGKQYPDPCLDVRSVIPGFFASDRLYPARMNLLGETGYPLIAIASVAFSGVVCHLRWPMHRRGFLKSYAGMGALAGLGFAGLNGPSVEGIPAYRDSTVKLDQ